MWQKYIYIYRPRRPRPGRPGRPGRSQRLRYWLGMLGSITSQR